MLELFKLIAIFLIIFNNCINLILTKPPPAYIKLTNFVCETADKNFIEFPICEVSRLKGNIYAVNMYAKLHVKKIENVTVITKISKYLYHNIN